MRRRTLELMLDKSKSRFAKRLESELGKSKRSRRTVNLSRIQRHTSDGEVVFIPGKVLGQGKLSRKLTVGAFSFSKTAIIKIAAAGGRALLTEDFLREFKDGSGVKIIG